MRTSRLALCLLVIGLIAPSVLYPIFLMKALCFALFAASFNLLVGQVGLLSFGHAMFFGSAGYVCAYLVKEVGWPTEAGILAGTLCAAVMGLIAGAVAIRRQGIYFAMVTLALSQMVYFYCLQTPLTGGEDGIQSVPRRPLLGSISIADDLSLYFFVLAVFLVGFLALHRIAHSPFGQILTAIRENEARAISLGYSVERYKLCAFVISATIAGLAGSTKVLVFQLASLIDVHWHTSGEVVLMTLIGGMGTVLGPVVGAFIVTALESYLSSFGQWILVIQGLVFMFVVLVFRRGVVGEGLAWYRRRTRLSASAR